MAQLFLPKELLEKLHCSACNLFLSIFPVYIHINGDKLICGRCRIPNEEEYLRDEAYEGIARFLLFPCSHAQNGCGEHLTPPKLKDHENCCTSRKVDCASKILSRCNWQGPTSDLKSHFEVSHASLNLDNNKFEIQFLNSVKENLLLSYEDELFIVKKEIDSRTGTFVCSVEHVIQSEAPDRYNYFIRVETTDSTFHHKFPERSTAADSERTKFTLEFIREQLHDPPAVLAYIGIVKTGPQEDEPMVKQEIKSPDVDWDLLSELECPVCLEYMLTPIYQCLNGHSICSVCKARVNPCPLCKTEIRNTQNFSLEKLAYRLIYPCKFHKSGCFVALKSTDIKRHEGTCEYGPYDCPLNEIEKCTIKTSKSEINSHVEKTHNAFILKSDKVNVSFSVGRDGQLEKYYIIQFAGRLFKVCFKYEVQKFYWALQLIGPAEDCSKFRLEVDVIDNSNKNMRHYARGLCSPFSKHAECFTTKGTYMNICYDQISDFITDNLSYRVRVVKD